MKIVAFITVLIVLSISCSRESPPSITEGTQDISERHIAPSRNRMTEQEPKEKTPTAVRNDKTFKVYIDPETGEFITPEEAEVLPEKKLIPPAAYSTSQEGLEESPSSVPGGGTMVDLKGRFQSPLTATIDSSGDIKIEHRTMESKN
jgi:hypothetical protein